MYCNRYSIIKLNEVVMKNVILILILALFFLNSVQTQDVSRVRTHINGLIENFDLNKGPGVGGAIIKNGELAYSYISGLADLETGAKNNFQTKFQIDDLAKQFTVYTLLHLIDDGKLSLEEDIRNHIPELQEYEYVIRVKHLLNHTTGLNDYNRIFEITGGTIDDHLPKTKALSLLKAQKELLFEPGTSFSIYDSDTEAMLMSLVISNVVDQSFEDYTEKFIFQELEMYNTFFVEHNRNLHKNIAKSYEEVDGSFDLKEIAHNISGPSNLYSTVEDLAKWYAYFSPKVNSPISNKVKRLDTPATSDDGKRYVSSWGEMKWGQYFRHAERGLPKDWQFGLIGGYGANVFKFPDEDITSFTIGNNNNYNGSIAMSALEPLLEDKYLSPPSIDPALIKTVPISLEKLHSFAGEYFTDGYGLARTIEVRNDSLIYKRPNGELKLLHIGDNRFQAIVQSDDVVIFEFDGKGSNRTYKFSSSGSDPLLYKVFERINYSTQELKKYEGVYINSTLSKTYEIKEKDGRLWVISFGASDIEFTPVMEDLFNSWTIHMTTIRFARKGEEISGFTIKTGGTGNIEFLKMK